VKLPSVNKSSTKFNVPVIIIYVVRVINSRRMRWAGHVARMGEKKTAYRLLVGKPEGKRPLRRPTRRWVDSIKMDHREKY
jgi:hypothetical protein